MLIRLGTALLSLGFSAVLLDGLFFAVHVESGSNAQSLAAKRWFCVHWNPIDTLGYRDEEPTRLEGRNVVYVVGDSFVAGQGVADYRARFSNRLEELLGPEWAVANIARIGWDTRQQRAALAKLQAPPDLVVLSYLINDIARIAASHGLKGSCRSGLVRWRRTPTSGTTSRRSRAVFSGKGRERGATRERCGRPTPTNAPGGSNETRSSGS